MRLASCVRSACTVALVLAPATSSCGGTEDDRLVVFAASSLTDVFDELTAEFISQHPGSDVVVSVGGSPSLVAQLEDGAPADVLATADIATMQRADRDGSLVGPIQVFATNTLVIAVEPENPLGISSIEDLAGDVVVVLAAPEVPAGTYAQRLLDRAGVELDPVSLESNVRAAAAKVALGEADAALVYRTDIAQGLDAVEIDGAVEVRADYPIAATSGDPLAAEFITFVLGEQGAQILSDGGFGAP